MIRGERPTKLGNSWLLKHGAILEWRWPAKGGNNLVLDTTPGSLFGKDDGVLVLGRTFSDREAGLHFTPVAVHFGEQKSVDVVVNVGQFPGNSAPALALDASTINVAVNTPVTINATATDADGNPLAYFWETGDAQVYENAAQFTRTFTTAGMYRVACTASDMKGGATMRCAIVNVGAHSQFSIAGRVTLDGAGMPGVLVRTSAHQAFTDEDGFYTLAGLVGGAQKISLVREGNTFTGTTDFNVGPSVTNANFSAVAGTFLTISAPLPNAAEGGAAGRFTLTRTGDTAAALTVLVEPISGSATKVADYALVPDVASNTFTIPAGQSVLHVDVLPMDDALAEGPETVTIQLVPDPAYAITGGAQATVTIQDNDTSLPLVSIDATLDHTIENDATPARFTVTRTGSNSNALTVGYTISGTATNGVDYIALPGFVTIPSGAASANIAITTIDDALNEGRETVTLTLADSAAYLIGTGTATVAIEDDDQQIITATAADADAAEVSGGSQNPGVFLISRSGDTSQPLTLFYSLTGTAIQGVDFETLPGSLTIPAGQSSAAITIFPIAEGIGEGGETVQLLLASLGTQYRIASSSPAIVTIADNPADPASIEVFTSNGFAQAGGNAGVFRLTARGGDGTPISVHFTMGGTAINGVDYAALSGTAMIPAGSGARTVDLVISPTPNAIVGPLETVTLSLANGAYTFRPQTGSATMWLHGNDAPVVFASAERDAPMEGGATSGFYLSRTGPTNGALAVNFTLTGTAMNGVDYVAVPLTATIPDGAGGVDVNVIPIDDALVEGTETIILTLGPGDYSESPVRAVLYLGDNDGGTMTAPIEVWRVANFGGDSGNVAIAGDLADPDSDGLANLLEYALNLDPKTVSRGPILGRERGFLTLTYRRKLAAADVTFTVEECLNLADVNSWSDATASEEIVSDDGITQVIKAKVSVGAESAHFVRLRVWRN